MQKQLFKELFDKQLRRIVYVYLFLTIDETISKLTEDYLFMLNNLFGLSRYIKFDHLYDTEHKYNNYPVLVFYDSGYKNHDILFHGYMIRNMLRNVRDIVILFSKASDHYFIKQLQNKYNFLNRLHFNHSLEFYIDFNDSTASDFVKVVTEIALSSDKISLDVYEMHSPDNIFDEHVRFFPYVVVDKDYILPCCDVEKIITKLFELDKEAGSEKHGL